LLKGQPVAAEIWSEVEHASARFAAQAGRAARLAVLRVGDDPASEWYLRQIARAFSARGLEVVTQLLDASADQATAESALAGLASDDSVDGILLQLPLPPSLQSDPLLESIPVAKDVEGLHPYHAGLVALGRPSIVPSTALAGLELLEDSNLELRGRLAVVVGRSPIVGRPLASLLLRADCTVVVCHSRTADLPAVTRQADILCAAVGRAALIDGSAIKPGATVLDFGTNDVGGVLVGDVDFPSASEVAAAITPVPGGIGPVTTAVLARNLTQVALARQSLAR
jgi:methylenetetrahydrofolate dehydrogenase (NADP+) / methenyltetrahydrofolate cyclohydrolase